MTLSRTVFVAATACTFACLGRAQAITLSDTYHAGLYGWGAFGGAYETSAATGEVAFHASGAASGNLDFFFEDANGPVSLPGQTFVATYHIDGRGLMALDLGGGPNDVWSCWVPPDANVLHYARTNPIEEAEQLVLVKKSAGMSNADLVGSYRFVSYRIDWWGNAGLERESGAVVFDGAGSVAYNLTATAIVGGVVSTSQLSGSTAYTVAPDGKLSLGGFCNVPNATCDVGAITSDGEFGFAIAGGLGQDQGISMFVRANAAPNLQQLEGRYGYTTHTMVGTEAETCLGAANVVASNATQGTWTGPETYVTSSPSGITVLNNNQTGNSSLTIANNTLLNQSNGFLDDRLWVSSNYRYVIGESRDFQDQSNNGEGIGITLCTRMAPAPESIGVATPGAAGAPALSTQGFALLGSTTFGFEIQNGVPSGLALLPVATASAPGLPALGGLIYVDPMTVGGVPLVPLDPSGCGVVSLPIPNNSALIGFALFSQALVLDPTTSGGFAMTAGLGVHIGAF